MHKATLVLVAAATWLVVSPATADGPEAQAPIAGAKPVDSRPAQPTKGDVFGVVAYDTGVTTGYTPNYVGSAIWGNLFDSDNGDPLVAGNLTWVSACAGFPLPVTASAVRVGLATGLDPTANTFAGTQQWNLGYVGPGCRTFTTSVPVGPSFIVGHYNRAIVSTMTFRYFGAQAWDSGSVPPQGDHGVVANVVAGTFNAIAGVNARVRVSGDILVPIELLDFAVE